MTIQGFSPTMARWPTCNMVMDWVGTGRFYTLTGVREFAPDAAEMIYEWVIERRPDRKRGWSCRYEYSPHEDYMIFWLMLRDSATGVREWESEPAHTPFAIDSCLTVAVLNCIASHEDPVLK